MLEQIKKAGIVGCGGAGFPTHVKLNCQVEYLIINAAECEPLLRTDRWLMIHKAAEIVSTVEKIAKQVSATKVFIALKETYQQEIAALEAAITGKNSTVKLYKMKNFYPAGDEQIMVCDITGRTVPPAGIPLDVGAVVSNVATIYSIYEADQGMMFTHKYLTMTGSVSEPIILHAPIGTSFQDCLEAAGGSQLHNYHIIAGGPLMGKCYTKEEAAQLTVTKTTSGFIVIPDDTPLVQKNDISIPTMLKRAKNYCIQCSYCTQMCPRYLTGHPLKPHLIMRRLAYTPTPEEVLGEAEIQQALICCECGVCEVHACPMGLQPRQVNIFLKNLMRQKNIRYQKPKGDFSQLEVRKYRRVPSKRLAIRLGVDDYYDYQIDRCITLAPKEVSISLQQHIGAPSIPIVSLHDNVACGQLIAKIPDNSLGANIHAGISGMITEISNSAITISATGQ